MAIIVGEDGLVTVTGDEAQAVIESLSQTVEATRVQSVDSGPVEQIVVTASAAYEQTTPQGVDIIVQSVANSVLDDMFIISHANLTNLASGHPHPQYLRETDANALYASISHVTGVDTNPHNLTADLLPGLSVWGKLTAPADLAFIEANLGNDSIPSTQIASIAASKITAGVMSARVVLGDVFTASHAGTVLSDDLSGVTVDDMRITMGYVTGNSGRTYMLRASNGYDDDDPSYIDKFWIDSNGNAFLSGTLYANTSSTGIGNFQDAGALATRDKTTFYQDAEPDPSECIVGDIWYDTDDGNKPHRFNGVDFDTVQDGDIAIAQGAIDGKTTSYWQPDEPTGLSATDNGDLWYNTGNGNYLKYYVHPNWVDGQDSQIGTAIANAATAQSTADGKTDTYYGDEPASVSGTGDLWYNTSTKILWRNQDPSVFDFSYSVGSMLQDTTEETVVASDLAVNGTFDADTDWTKGTGWAIATGVATATASSATMVQTTSALTIGETYTVNYEIKSRSSGTVAVSDGDAANDDPQSTVGWHSVTFVATGDTLTVTAAGFTGSIDNVSCRLGDVDLSPTGHGLQYFGTIDKAAVYVGQTPMAYSGFSASNYLYQNYEANMDFTDGTMSFGGWVRFTSPTTDQTIFAMGDIGSASGQILLRITSTGYIQFDGGTSAGTVTSVTNIVDTSFHHIGLSFDGDEVQIYLDGVLNKTGYVTNWAYSAHDGLYIGYTGSADPADVCEFSYFKFSTVKDSGLTFKEMRFLEKGAFAPVDTVLSWEYAGNGFDSTLLLSDDALLGSTANWSGVYDDDGLRPADGADVTNVGGANNVLRYLTAPNSYSGTNVSDSTGYGDGDWAVILGDSSSTTQVMKFDLDALLQDNDYTVSFWAHSSIEGATFNIDLYSTTNVVGEYDIPVSTTPQYYTYTWSSSDAAMADSSMVLRAYKDTGDVSPTSDIYVYDVKFEWGSQPTAWTPYNPLYDKADTTQGAFENGVSVTGGYLQLNSGGAIYTGAKNDYSSTAAGFYIGYDASEADYVVNIGDATNYIKWDGTTLSVAGAIGVGDDTYGALQAGVTLTAGGVTLNTAASVKSGKTTYASTTAGFFLGSDSGTPKFHIGNSSNWLKWDGTNLTLNGAIGVGDVTSTALQSGVTITGGGVTLSAGGSFKSTGLTSENVTGGTAGVWLGYNGTSSKYTFGVGNATQFMIFDGTDLELVAQDISINEGGNNRIIFYSGSYELVSIGVPYGGYGTAKFTAYGGYPGVEAYTTSGTGVMGQTESGYGVNGNATAGGKAVYGYAAGAGSIGVYGYSYYTGVLGAAYVGGTGSGVGVKGEASGTAQQAVFGENFASGGGYGVHGKGYRGINGEGTNYDFYATGSGTNYGPFTGGHDGLVKTKGGVDYTIGDIVVDVACVARKGISNTIFENELCSTPYQYSAIGVLSTLPHYIGIGNVPAALLNLPDSEFKRIKKVYKAVSFNALGEGQINVCGQNGDIKVGDYIVTSNIPGKGMRQDDDILHSYTVARAREAITFDEPDQIKTIACIYLCG